MRSMLFAVAFLALLAGGCADASKAKPEADGRESAPAKAGDGRDERKAADVKLKDAPAVGRADDPELTGMWRQMIRNSDKEPWRLLALVEVGRGAKGLTLEQLDYTVVKRGDTPAEALTESATDGDKWSFRADWGRIGKGEFRLRRTADGAYEGDVLHGGKLVRACRMERLEGNGKLRAELRRLVLEAEKEQRLCNELYLQAQNTVDSFKNPRNGKPNSFQAALIQQALADIQREDLRITVLEQRKKRLNEHLARVGD